MRRAAERLRRDDPAVVGTRMRNHWRAPPPGVARCYKMRDVLPLWFEESS